MYTHEELFTLFDTLYKSDKLLTIITLGGGAKFSQILETPGLSKYISDIHNIYDTKQLKDLLLHTGNIDFDKLVTYDNTMSIGINLADQFDANIIIINAALTTNRLRHGCNIGFYYIRYNNKEKLGTVYLSKEEDASFYNSFHNVLLKRRTEDDTLCEEVLREFFNLASKVNYHD